MPSSHIVSIHPVIEMAGGFDSDDHRDLSFAEAQAIVIVLDLYDRDSELDLAG